MCLYVQCEELLGRLVSIEGLSDRQGLYRAHTRPLLASFADTYPVWTTHSMERLVFDTVMLQAGM